MMTMRIGTGSILMHIVTFVWLHWLAWRQLFGPVDLTNRINMTK